MGLQPKVLETKNTKKERFKQNTEKDWEYSERQAKFMDDIW